MISRRQGLLLVGLAITAGLAAFGPSDEDAAVPVDSSARSQKTRVATKQPSGDGAVGAVDILALKPRSPSVFGAGGLFAPLVTATPAGQAAGQVAAQASSSPPPPSAPTAPELPFRVLGKTMVAGRVEVFLAKGDAVVIARDNMVIDDVWLVDQIKPPLMRLTYLPLKQEQQMSIGVFK